MRNKFVPDKTWVSSGADNALLEGCLFIVIVYAIGIPLTGFLCYILSFLFD